MEYDQTPYWATLRENTPQKLEAMKRFVKKNKMDVVDSEIVDDNTFKIKFLSKEEAAYFQYVSDGYEIPFTFKMLVAGKKVSGKRFHPWAAIAGLSKIVEICFD